MNQSLTMQPAGMATITLDPFSAELLETLRRRPEIASVRVSLKVGATGVVADAEYHNGLFVSADGRNASVAVLHLVLLCRFSDTLGDEIA